MYDLADFLPVIKMRFFNLNISNLKFSNPKNQPPLFFSLDYIRSWKSEWHEKKTHRGEIMEDPEYLAIQQPDTSTRSLKIDLA